MPQGHGLGTLVNEMVKLPRSIQVLLIILDIIIVFVLLGCFENKKSKKNMQLNKYYNILKILIWENVNFTFIHGLYTIYT